MKPFPWLQVATFVLGVATNVVAVYVTIDHRMDAIESRITVLEATLKAKNLIRLHHGL